MDTLTEIINIFAPKSYGTVIPFDPFDEREMCDDSCFTAWYMDYIFGYHSILSDGETDNGEIYTVFNSINSKIYEGETKNLDLNALLNGDCVIFSNNPSFTGATPGSTWSGIYWDDHTFLNFNEREGFGSDSLERYINGEMNFAYVSVFRVRPESDPSQCAPDRTYHPEIHVPTEEEQLEHALNAHKDLK